MLSVLLFCFFFSLSDSTPESRPIVDLITSCVPIIVFWSDIRRFPFVLVAAPLIWYKLLHTLLFRSCWGINESLSDLQCHYLQTFMRRVFFFLFIFSSVLANCMYEIYVPEGTLVFAASERSHWGSELYGRYISIQEHKSRRVRLSRWFIPQPQTLQKSVVNPFGITLGSHQRTQLEKNRDSCLHIQLSVFLCRKWESKIN